MSRKTSQKRIEANRRNALKSTGPRTAEGKAKSAQNSTTHGFSTLAPGTLLHIEDPAAYQSLLDEYLATYRPQHRDEMDLLNEAVYAKWRQQRIWLAESAQLEVAIAQNERDLTRALPAANAAAHLANGFAKSESILKLYLRYDAQLNRHYRQCLKDLQDLQASRSTPDPEPDPEPIEPNLPAEPPTPIEPKPPAPEPEPESKSEAPVEPISAEEARQAAFLRYVNRQLGRPDPAA